MSLIVKSSLSNSMSYQEYRLLVKRLIESNSTLVSGMTESELALMKLNNSRMKRWDKKIKITKELQKVLAKFNYSTTWLVITEGWCTDSAHMLPALNKIAEYSDKVDLRIVLRHEHTELINAFLTYGKPAIPKVLMIDNENEEVVYTYGPRPSKAAYFVNRFLAKHGELTTDFKEDLQYWYNDDKGENILEDVSKILAEFGSNVYL